MANTSTLLAEHRAYFNSGETRDIEFRKAQLRRLKNAILASEDAIYEALREDLNKSRFEAYEVEIGIVLEEIGYLLRNLHHLARPKRVKTPLFHFPASSKVIHEPYGTVLIMSPWNYPFQLTLAPLAGAIACGNCAVVKPSNYSPRTSAVIRQLLGKVFEPRYVSVIEGGREVNQSLLDEQFDYIFFTGSVAVGKTVMAAAARHLTPVTLELGGKSPCIVAEDADIALAAKRIAWGKFVNAGQTCVAPDYVLAHRNVRAELTRQLQCYVRQFYGEEPHKNPEYPKIITEKHFVRLTELVAGEEVAFGGRANAQTRQIEPTVLAGSTWASPSMEEEIFGPVLPVLEYEELSEVIRQVNGRPKPLALYLFTKSRQLKQRVLGSISSGGVCINDTVVHMATSYMGFGGVGESGMGAYHGKESLSTFSHRKSVMEKSNLIDLPVRYPPFGDKLKWLKMVMK